MNTGKRLGNFMGVDGGGTKTTFTVISNKGEILGTRSTSGLHHPDIGLSGVINTLSIGFDQVLKDARLMPDELASVFVGCPGYGEDTQCTQDFELAVRTVFPKSAVCRCENDGLCSWAGSLGCGDGISVACGTGSIAYGVKKNIIARAGGWGEIIGDEGSAYWLATKGLNLFSRMSDRILEHGQLYDALISRFDLNRDLDLIGIIYDRNKMTRKNIADIAKTVVLAADCGDSECLRLIDRASNHLIEIVESVARKLNFGIEDEINVSYSGSMFTENHIFLKRFQSRVNSGRYRFNLTKPIWTPDIGAALLAAQQVGEEIIPRATSVDFTA